MLAADRVLLPVGRALQHNIWVVAARSTTYSLPVSRRTRVKTPTPAARRNILEKLRVMRTDNAANIRLDAVLENCMFPDV